MKEQGLSSLSHLKENVNFIDLTNLTVILVPIKMEGGKERLFGFKFILPSMYPFEPPICLLDEPESQLIIEVVDYIGSGNVINH